jgi:hypothetical protein
MASMTAAQLRGALAKYRERARHGRFPQDLRDQATAYARERVRAGAAIPAIASELGVSETTVGAWAGDGAQPMGAPRGSVTSAAVAMVPLVVRPAPEMASARLEVLFPDGTKLQVSGMAGRELVDTIVALRGSR